jgi:hypothetical protein
MRRTRALALLLVALILFPLRAIAVASSEPPADAQVTLATSPDQPLASELTVSTPIPMAKKRRKHAEAVAVGAGLDAVNDGEPSRSVAISAVSALSAAIDEPVLATSYSTTRPRGPPAGSRTPSKEST